MAPYRYSQYIQETFQHNDDKQKKEPYFLDADLPFSVQLPDGCNYINLTTYNEDAASYTRQQWNKVYPKEPFFLNKSRRRGGFIKKWRKNHKEKEFSSSLCGFDILESCDRQSAFLWQVSGKYHVIFESLHDLVVDL